MTSNIWTSFLNDPLMKIKDLFMNHRRMKTLRLDKQGVSTSQSNKTQKETILHTKKIVIIKKEEEGGVNIQQAMTTHLEIVKDLLGSVGH